jgi:hypothetical protein
VVLDDLTPETTYHFQIMSGSQVAQSESITTASSLESLPESDTIYGQILKADGITPATNSLVYLTLQDADGADSVGEATLLSALVDAEGYWHANLGNARSADEGEAFTYSESGDVVVVTVESGTNRTLTKSLDTGDLRPARLIYEEKAAWQLYLPLIGH